MADVKTTTAAIYQAVLDSLNSKGECGVLPPAPPGKSAYEVAVANGFKGSEKQWLDSLTIKQENEIARLEARIVDSEKITKDSKYAASRLVGTAGGNVAEINGFGIAGTGWGSTQLQDITANEMDKPSLKKPSGIYRSSGGTKSYTPIVHINYSGEARHAHQLAFELFANEILFRRAVSADAYTEFFKIFHSGNTTRDVGTGFLKVSSPVLHVYNDKITKIHEAEQLDITVDKKGVGHYEIHGTTGLRKNDGWFMSPPRDVHGNVLCMVDLDEKDGVITLKTYKKKFDFDIVAIVHDYENPMDIPEGACVEFRFNDLPQENLEEPLPEVTKKKN